MLKDRNTLFRVSVVKYNADEVRNNKKKGETMETETIKETKINQYHLDNEIELKKKQA